MLLNISASAQKVTEEMKERANELFEKEQYVEATPLFLQILSLEPKEADWNFKYGACLLFNSGEKKKSIRYLMYGVNTAGTDHRVFYFYAKALHLDYQFDAAKKHYQKYLSKRPKPDKRYPVEREIGMCENGKKLLTTFTDIIVTDKKQISESNFYEIYSDSRTIGGVITLNRDFQSKLDKKKGHIPTVHFGPNARVIFYSSYGDDESTGKDIYMRIRLPDGSWGKPQIARGGVNSNEDEDYPFMHASGKFLYFSSKGHNSMGGYDVFMCRFDPNTNSFGTPENVDFAISSPDDDLFYVVDSTFSNAYFASSRSSEKDKLHVYKVKVARVPIQEVIVMGNFVSEINPEDQKISIQMLKHTNGEELVTMPVTAAKGGRYSYVFPQGGKYDYVVEVDGSGSKYKFTIELPFLDEFRPLKQQIIHTTENGNEIVRIINKFDENVDGAEAIIAEIIRKKSELDVNVDQFNLEEIEARQDNGEILADLGFDKMTLREVSDKILELQQTSEQNKEINDRLTANVSSELLAKAERVKALDQMEKELRESAEKTSDPVTKHKLMTEASQKQQEKERLLNQIAGLEKLLEDIEETNSKGIEPEKIAAIQQKFETMRGDDETEALKYLATEKETIDQARSGSPNEIRDGYISETLDIRQDLDKAKIKRKEYRSLLNSNEQRIATLKREREGAKRKEQERIDNEIADLEEGLRMAQGEIDRLDKEIYDLEIELNSVEERMASYQNALATEEKAEVDNTEVVEATQDAKAIAAEEEYDYENALAVLEKENPEINGGEPIANWSEEIENTYEDEKEAINNDSSLSPLEQASKLVESNEKALKSVNEKLRSVKERLAGEDNEKLLEQEKALTEQKATLEAENETLKAEEKRLKEETPDAALSLEDVLEEVVPGLDEKKQTIRSNPDLTEAEKLTQTRELLVTVGEQLERELEIVEEIVSGNPDDELAKARRELLKQLIAENTQELDELDTQIASLPVEITQEISPEEAIASVDDGYQARIEEIANNEGTPIEKEQAILNENEALLKKLEKEATKAGRDVEKNPNDETLIARKKALDQAIAGIEGQISENSQTIAALSGSGDNVVSSEQIMSEVAPNFEQDRATIENGDDTELEKAKSLLKLEGDTRDDLEKELAKWEKKVDRNPEDTEAQAQVKAINEAIAARTTSIQSINERIVELNTESPLTSISAEEIIAELQPDVSREIEEVDESDDTESSKARRKAIITAGLLETLQKEANKTERDLNRNPEDEEAQSRKKALDIAIAEQKEKLTQFEQEAAEALTNTEKEALISEVSSEYTRLSPESSNEEKIAAEQQLQKDIEEAIAKKEESLSRSYSVSVAIEKASYEKLLEESRVREAALNESTPVASEETTFVEGLRTNAGPDISEVLSEEKDDLDLLRKQDETLAGYEEYLNDQIEIQEQVVEVDPTPENEETLAWLVAEKERVTQKRRSISISIGELEQVAVTNPGESPEVRELRNEEKRIQEAKENDNLGASEKKELDRELREVREKRFEIENEKAEEKLRFEEQTTESLTEDLTRAGSDNEIARETIEHAEAEEKAIAEIEGEAEKADSEAERSYLLNQAMVRREALNRDMNDAVVSSELAKLEETYDIATTSRNDLEKQKRSYTIQIGEITREIDQVNQQISEAKRKEVPALEIKRDELIQRKEQIEARLKRVDEQLGKVSPTPTAVNSNAMDTEIGFNEERELAATEEYETYQKAAVEALSVGNEIRTLEQELEQEQVALQRLVRNNGSQEEIQSKALEVQSIEEEIDRRKIELTQKKYEADQLLPENETEAMKMQNMVARGIQPLKVTAVATALIQMPTTGFAIDTTSERPNSGAIEIPVGVEHPEGLVYRVQVGAFARPLRPDVFKEFNPVSGEKIEGTNITRYMAGYFSSSESVVEARQQIRGLGYSDAFVVAYCNGERITLGEARRREAAGICVPKRTEEILIEVAENTAKNLNIPVSSDPQELPEWSYADAPGAVEAEPIEKMKGLFFTVQIGVFNRPVTSAELKNMPAIFTFRLPNGQIRYNTGMFDSAEEALPRQGYARSNGIQGAFIVAYYQGKRISIGNARRLLLEYGNSILQSRMQNEPETMETDVVRQDSVRRDVIEIVPMEEWEKRVQIVTEDTFEEFPRDVLNRYNAEGSFYFDETDKRVKSTIYENEEYLPNLFNFRDDIDTIYLEEGLLDDQKTETIYFVFTDSLVPGAFMDWMLRCNYRREINRTFKGTEVRIFGVQEEKMEEVIERIRLFGVEPEKIKEEE